MRRNRPIVLLSCLLVALAAGPAAAGDERILTETVPAADLAGVRFDMSVGELVISPGSGPEIAVEIEAECRRARRDCEDALEDLRIDQRRRGNVLLIELDGYPKWGKGRLEIDAVLSIPAELDLEVDMGVGEIDIEGLRGELDVELGVGEVEIATETAHLRSIDLDVGVGEAEIRGDTSRVEGRRSFLVGSEAYWAGGEGDKRIRVDLGVGEVSVHLD